MVFNKLNWLKTKNSKWEKNQVTSKNLVLVNYFNTFEQNVNLIRIKTLKFDNSLLLLAFVKGYWTKASCMNLVTILRTSLTN